MKKLLSLPPNVVPAFHAVTGLPRDEYFCTADPADRKLGSGGGTTWLLYDAYRTEVDAGAPVKGFGEWLRRERRILLHAGGQGRRLPAYAPSGKVLTPVPVFRWARGQKIDQTLLDMQLPLYEALMQRAPAGVHTLVASGDVYLRATQELPALPEADVVCFGLWASPEEISHHGAFLMERAHPGVLDFMLQKPDVREQARYLPTHFTLMDVGLWLLSDKAVMALMRKSGSANGFPAYDLYSEFGCALGCHASRPDPSLAGLSVAIVQLPGGEFYHFGTGPELLTSTMALQNLVKDQRLIIQRKVKRQPSLFTQNCRISNALSEANEYIWVENARLGAGWHLANHHIVTGVTENDWHVELRPGTCIDIVPVGEKAYALRPYGYTDTFRGAPADSQTQYLGQPFPDWARQRGLTPEQLASADDLQATQLFPVSESLADLERLFHWMAEPPTEDATFYLSHERLSANDLCVRCNLPRLFAERRAIERETLPTLAHNWRKSVFYQVDLHDMAQKYRAARLPLPDALPPDADIMARIHDAMFRSEVLRDTPEATPQADKAFRLLQEALTDAARRNPVAPRRTTQDDQIVWGRAAARIDLAGGWTDTPPYCLLAGGNVVNMAIEMNGQQPLQVYVKPCREPVVICRSIDLGAMERIETYEELAQYRKVGSPFSIPKAALTLCGFLPGYGRDTYPSLRSQLQAFGCGIEVTLLSAIPAGSGLGTSSILAATVLGSLSDFCGLHWDKNEICARTLILEQLLTTGGGWQDQLGGVLPGVKMLQTEAGFAQNIVTRWLPDTLFTAPGYRECHQLYYTGLTRTAKHILAEIVRGMFLNSAQHLAILEEMKSHALDLFDIIQRGDFEGYGRALRTTWELNKALDAGTCPPAIAELARRVDDLCLGYKLPGAGGGGFMYMVAKDTNAALRIRSLLAEQPLAPNARFVRLSISDKGLQVSRS